MSQSSNHAVKLPINLTISHKQTTNRPIKQSNDQQQINQPIKTRTHSIKQPTEQPIKQATNQNISQINKQPSNKSRQQSINEQTKQSIE